MPETTSVATAAAKGELHQESPFHWLLEIELDDTNSMTVCDGDAPVTALGKTWSPFPFAVDGIEADGEGNLSEPSITISNLSSEIASRLDAGGLVDRFVRIYQMHRSDTAFAWDRGRFKILDVTLDNTTATAQLGSGGGLFDAVAPARLQLRHRCNYGDGYGGEECGYDKSLPNLISGTHPSFEPSRCDFSKDGPNGCTPHGLNEAANGRPNLHPERMGSYEGVPKGPGRL